MKEKRNKSVICICFICMLFVALSIDFIIRKTNYLSVNANNNIKEEVNVNENSLIDKFNFNINRIVDDYANNYNNFKKNFLNELEKSNINPLRNDSNKDKIIIVKKVLVSTTFTLKAAFLYVDLCLKEKLKAKHNNCTYEIVNNIYDIKEIKKD